MVCVIVGIAACVIVVVTQFMSRANKVKKGYEVDSMTSLIVRCVLAVAAIMLFAYKLAMAGGIPTVLIDRDIPGEGFGRVLLDNYDSGVMATKYLFHQGFGKIEMISYKMGVTSLIDREQGYAAAMEDAGLKDEIRLHRIEYDADAAKKGVIEIFRDALKRRTEAFILPTKKLAMYSFNALNVLGLNLPKDFSFVCFDESDIYDLKKPMIPHVVQPVTEIAEKSFGLLRKMIDGNVSEEEKTIILKAKLILGGRLGVRPSEASF